MPNELIFNEEGDGIESATKANAIPYRIVLRDPSEMPGTITPQQVSRQVKCQVRFEDARRWERAMLGTCDPQTGGGTGLSRVLPEQFPWLAEDDPGDPDKLMPFYCVELHPDRHWANGLSIDSEDPNYLSQFKNPQPDPALNQYPHPGWAEYTALFAALPYKVLGDAEIGTPHEEWKRFAYAVVRYASDNERVPGGGYKLVGEPGAAPLMETFTRRSSINQIDLFLIGVPNIPRAKIRAISGGVNDADFQVGDDTYPAETVQFDSYSREQVYDPRGLVRFNYCFKLLARDEGDGRHWNNYRKTDGVLRRLSHDGTAGGTPPFKKVSFPDLFKWA